MASATFDKLLPDLINHDVSGSYGCGVPSSRSNLLVNFTYRIFDDESIWLMFDQYTPEGYGVESFHKDSLEVPGDEILNPNQMLLWDLQQSLPPQQCKIWLTSVIDDVSGNFCFDSLSQWLLVEKESYHHRPLHVLELFGGGMGGWKSAGSFLEESFQQHWETIAIEQELDVAACYAATHQASLLTSLHHLPIDFFTMKHANWIIQADIRDATWHPFVAAWGVDALLMSPPCQPWSGAAHGPGLDRDDGLLTAQGLLLCRWFRPHYVGLEQVAGFQSHPHKPLVIRILKWLGYRIVFEKVVDLSDQSPSRRQRYLLAATRVHSCLTAAPFKRWFRQDFVAHPNLCCIQMPEAIAESLRPSPQVVQIASDPESCRGTHGKSPEQVLDGRIFQDGQCVPTFMAKYGSQHEFEPSFLKSHGYFGHFVGTNSVRHSFRFWHPAEIAIIHGLTHPTFLPENFKKAWHIVGNQICLPHALLIVADLFFRLHHFDYSPFVVFSQFQMKRFKGPVTFVTHFPGGMLISPTNDCVIQPQVEKLFSCVDGLPTFQCWHPVNGLQQPGELQSTQPGQELDNVTVGTISPTMHFVVSAPAQFVGPHTFTFWCDADIPRHTLESLWFDQVRCQFHSEPEPGSPSITIHPTVSQSIEPSGCWEALITLVDGELSVWKTSPTQPLVEHEKVLAFGDTMFDQFGALGQYQKTRFDSVILSAPMVVEICHQSPIYLFAAFRSATIEIHWDPSLHDTLLLIAGESPGVGLLMDFWTSLFSSSQLRVFGLQCTTEPEVGGIRFVPFPNTAVLPPAPFHLALGIAAVRSLFQLIPVCNPYFVRLSWHSRPLWAGHLSSDCSVQLILNILGMGLGVVLQIEAFSLVHKARRVDTFLTVEQLVIPEQDEIVLHVVPRLTGGGPSKQQQKLLAKNAIAAVLLEHGLEIGWVKKTVDSLHDQCGLPKLQQIVSGSTHSQKLKEIKQAALDLGLHFPAPQTPTNQHNQLGMAKSKRRKEQPPVINPAEYKVDPSFFLTADKQPAMQLPQLRANASGFCLVMPHDATPWLRANQAISTDELGAVVLGKLLVETDLPSEPITMPCTDASGQAVLLSGTLIQLGGKNLTYTKGDPKQVDAVAGHLMSITLFKEDWNPEQWTDATSNPLAFISKALEREQLKESVQAIWGRSLRAGRAQATPAQATTIQVHCTVVDQHKDKLLQASGLNSLFFTPKTRSGRVDPEYKIIWIEGDHAQAVGLATQVPHCLGLIKGRTTYGLRFAETKFADAWTKIHPGQKPPPRSVGHMTYKIEGLPFGCTCDMLSKWGDKVSWKIVPFKALGPSTWLIKTDQQVPQGLLHFNTAPVLVRYLPPRDVDNPPLLVGPRPKAVSRDLQAPLATDPWANYSGTRTQSTPSVVPVRSLDGPVASKMKEQDDKIATLQSDLKKLAQHSEKQFAVVEKKMDESEKQQAAQFGKMENTIQTLSSNINQALQTSLQQNSALMEQKMNELKALFQTKRRRDDDPME